MKLLVVYLMLVVIAVCVAGPVISQRVEELLNFINKNAKECCGTCKRNAREYTEYKCLLKISMNNEEPIYVTREAYEEMKDYLGDDAGEQENSEDREDNEEERSELDDKVAEKKMNERFEENRIYKKFNNARNYGDSDEKMLEREIAVNLKASLAKAKLNKLFEMMENKNEYPI